MRLSAPSHCRALPRPSRLARLLSADYRPDVVRLVDSPWTSEFLVPAAACALVAALVVYLARRIPSRFRRPGRRRDLLARLALRRRRARDHGRAPAVPADDRRRGGVRRRGRRARTEARAARAAAPRRGGRRRARAPAAGGLAARPRPGLARRLHPVPRHRGGHAAERAGLEQSGCRAAETRGARRGARRLRDLAVDPERPAVGSDEPRLDAARRGTDRTRRGRATGDAGRVPRGRPRAARARPGAV